MMKSASLVALLVLCLFSNAYAGHFQTGASLMQGRREYQKVVSSQLGREDYLSASRFVGYVIGVTDIYADALQIPAGVTVDHVCTIVGKYLEAHPERWDTAGSILVFEAPDALKGKR